MTYSYKKRCKTENNWKNGEFSVNTFKGHTDWVRCLQFEKDVLISGSADKSIKVCDKKETKTKQEQKQKQKQNNLLIRVQIWDMNTQECLKTLAGHNRCINCLSYDNCFLASACTSVKISIM